MIDWSATAAWITLAVTLTFSIASPIITTILNNRFQLKMAELTDKQKEKENHYLKKRDVIDAFISSTGKCIFYANTEILRQCGEKFYSIYIYSPASLWGSIDELLSLINSRQWERARANLADLSKALADVLEESRQQDQQL